MNEEQYTELFRRFRKALVEQEDLFHRKCIDYGIRNISLGSELKSKEDIDFSLQGIWFRMMDKMNRWRTIQEKGTVNNESLLDTFEDLANYATIAKLVQSKKWMTDNGEKCTGDSSEN